MKEKIISLLLVIIIVMFIPVFVTTIMNGILSKAQQDPVNVDIQIDKKQDEGVEVTVSALVNGQKENIELEEYLIGVLAAEMPVEFHEEALRAQAVAARTYTLKKMSQSNDFVFTNTDQAYRSQSELEELWGVENYVKYYNKIKNAVLYTKNQVIQYQGDLIEAVFHSTSAGKTQSAVDVWGEDIPYLVSVESLSDLEAPGYEYTETFTQESIIQAIKEKESDFEVYTNNLFNEIQIIERSQEGYVREMQIGNKIYDGETFRAYLGLKSSNFYFNKSGNDIEIVSKGYGHGVGMSQYGANALAHDGYRYEEILKHYYTDIEVVRNNWAPTK